MRSGKADALLNVPGCRRQRRALMGDSCARRQAVPQALHYTRRVHPLRIPFTGERPYRAHSGDAGADLVASEDVLLNPGERALVGTGTRIALPEGTLGFVVPRSGLAARHGVTIVNAPGTIDSGYRGEIRVCLLNTDRDEPVAIRAGERIAQLIVLPYPPVEFVQSDRLPDGERAERGFGSTGRTVSISPADAAANDPTNSEEPRHGNV